MRAAKQINLQSIPSIHFQLTLRSFAMNVSKLIVAAGFAVATTGAFAETGVKTGDLGSVANVYGRASVATVQIKGDVVTQPSDVAEAGRINVKGDSAIAVNSGSTNAFGRS
jgi:hypothetical protein